MSLASRKGLSAVAASAADHRIVLTSHGRAVAVIDTADRLDEDVRVVREAALAVLDAAANLVSDRSTKSSLADVCTRLGIDIEKVNAKVALRRTHG